MDKETVSRWFYNSKTDEVDTKELKNHVGEMHTWMRNLEQHLMSLNARLAAVEQRITSSKLHSFDYKPSSLNDDTIHSMNSSMIAMNELTTTHIKRLDDEISTISEQVTSLQHQQTLNVSFHDKTVQDIKQIKHKNKAQPMIMRLGKKEIPLELSGVIGGFICFIVAGLTFIGATEIVLSPWFLAGIGLLLLGGTFIRSEFSISLIKKIIGMFFHHSNKSRAHHSDSTP
jgi:hypothetical protein